MTREMALKLRAAIMAGAASLPDETAQDVPELFPRWETGVQYVVGDRRSHHGALYSVIQAHRSQDDWTPDVTPALWKRVFVEEWPEWIQPTGAHDAYNTGDKCAHNGKHWQSLVNGNVWEPGATGTESLWAEQT